MIRDLKKMMNNFKKIMGKERKGGLQKILYYFFGKKDRDKLFLRNLRDKEGRIGKMQIIKVIKI